MKYFGTDGIRGTLENELSEKLLKKVAKAIVLCLKKEKSTKLLVGNDSRITSDYMLSVLSNILLKNGIEIHNVGLCSSPCLAFLTKKHNYPLSLMLSASHNPAEYNGLKFFNSKGEKVSDTFEEKFEILMDKKCKLKNNSFTISKNVECLKNDYLNHLKTLINFSFPCIFDCANGGTSDIVKQLFPKQEKINIKPTGKNINLDAGCTHIEMLRKLCVEKQKIGFAFDGDGDRIHMIDKEGNVISGDKILYILSQFFTNKSNICVGTIYTNSGLEESLLKRQIKLKRSAVGDKNVYKHMIESNSNLGGEDSGHIILKDLTNTGDGVLIAIVLANILQISKKSIKELLENYHEYHQERKNIKISFNSNMETILNNISIQNFIKESEKIGAKIIIRPSGTEPLIRLFVEHQNKETAKRLLNKLSDLIS